MSFLTQDTEEDEQLRRIQSVTDAALAHLELEDLLVELLERVRKILRVDTAVVLLLDNCSGDLVATAAKGLEEEVRQAFHLAVGRGFAGRIAAEKRAVVVDDVDETKVVNPILLDKGLRSLLGVPLLAGGTVYGVLHVGSLAPRRFTDDDIGLLQLVADRAALAVRAATAERERSAAKVLQRSLLPSRLPDIPGAELAARHVAASAHEVGGDWYDVFTLPSGCVGLAVGDVIGRGLQAAVVMGRMRSALRAYALETDDPAEVLHKLGRKVEHYEPTTMATVLYATVEPSLERLHLSLAGHPPPVQAVPDRPASVIDVPPDPPVGAPTRRARRASAVPTPHGSVTCFYTDGLVERRDDPLDVGLTQLCDAVAAEPAESVCARVMAKLVGQDDPDDDVALLAFRRT